MNKLHVILLLATLWLAGPVMAQQKPSADKAMLDQFAKDWQHAKSDSTTSALEATLSSQIKLVATQASDDAGKTLHPAYSLDCLTYPKSEYRLELTVVDFEKGKYKPVPGFSALYWMPTQVTEAELVSHFGTPPNQAAVDKAIRETPRSWVILKDEPAATHWGVRVRMLWRDPAADSKTPYTKVDLQLSFANALPG